jgi:hypothetical protein
VRLFLFNKLKKQIPILILILNSTPHNHQNHSYYYYCRWGCRWWWWWWGCLEMKTLDKNASTTTSTARNVRSPKLNIPFPPASRTTNFFTSVHSSFLFFCFRTPLIVFPANVMVFIVPQDEKHLRSYFGQQLSS